MKFLMGMAMLCAATTAAAQAPALDLRGVDPALTVEPTKVMVLGSTHLSAYRDTVSPDDIMPLLDRLATYAPDVITIESVSGETCELIRIYQSEYPGTADSYCHDVSAYRTESGMSASEGAAQARMLLKNWPAKASGSDRRALAAAFLAAAEPYSALVQWMRLSDDQRQAGEGLGQKSLAFLSKLEGSMNENGQIGARLAARLGLERVFAIDDHSSDIVIAGEGDALWDRMSDIWLPKSAPFKVQSRAVSAKIADGGILEAYRFYNKPDSQISAVNNDFRRAMNDAEPEQYGRKYNAWYQVRNLRMVSSIVAAGATKPGGRVLSVVGLSHKPYFEAYLDLMHDIEIVSTDSVLR